MKFSNSFSNKPKPVKIFGMVIIAILVGGGLALLVMLIWNAILPEVAGAKEINFWQAMGLLILSKILFGGFRMGSFSKSHRSEKKRQWKDY